MSTTEEKCCIEQCIACLDLFIAKAKEALALMKEIKEWECCDCTDPVDPVDPTDPKFGEEYRVDPPMTSDAGVVYEGEHYTPISCSKRTDYPLWHLFQTNEATNGSDCWFGTSNPSADAPEWVGLSMGESYHWISKVELVTRVGDSRIYCPKKLKLWGLGEDNQWKELSDMINVPASSQGLLIEIPVLPQNFSKVKSVRAEIYESYPVPGYLPGISLSRMRIYGKKVA